MFRLPILLGALCFGADPKDLDEVRDKSIAKNSLLMSLACRDDCFKAIALVDRDGAKRILDEQRSTKECPICQRHRADRSEKVPSLRAT